MAAYNNSQISRTINPSRFQILEKNRSVLHFVIRKTLLKPCLFYTVNIMTTDGAVTKLARLFYIVMMYEKWGLFARKRYEVN